jgi:hypothetical protein
MTQTTEYRIIGVTDEQTECDECGRVELKRTVILADADGTEAGRYGTTCASRIVGRPLTAAHVDNIEAVRRSNMIDTLRSAKRQFEAGGHGVNRAIMMVNEARRDMIRPDEIEFADRIKVAGVAVLRRRRDEGQATTMGPNTLPPKSA